MKIQFQKTTVHLVILSSILSGILGCKKSNPSVAELKSNSSSTYMAVEGEPFVKGTIKEGSPFRGGHYIDCSEDQDFAYFNLNRITDIHTGSLGLLGNPIPEPNDLETTTDLQGTDVNLHNLAIRFDFCLGENEEIYFHRAILRQRGHYSFGRRQPKFLELNPASIEKNPIYADALFADDFSNLHMMFTTDDANAYSYLIRGYKNNEGRSFLTISAFKDLGNPLLVATGRGDRSTVSMGTLEYGDSFSEYDRSIDNRKWQKAQFAHIDDAFKLNLIYDVECNGGGYRNYNFKKNGKLEITDSTAGLTEPVSFNLSADQLQTGFDSQSSGGRGGGFGPPGGGFGPPGGSGGSSEKPFKYVSSHHNLSDKFIFTTPSATYSILKGSSSNAILQVDYDEALQIPQKRINIKRILAPLSRGRRSKC